MIFSFFDPEINSEILREADLGQVVGLVTVNNHIDVEDALEVRNLISIGLEICSDIFAEFGEEVHVLRVSILICIHTHSNQMVFNKLWGY